MKNLLSAIIPAIAYIGFCLFALSECMPPNAPAQTTQAGDVAQVKVVENDRGAVVIDLRGLYPRPLLAEDTPDVLVDWGDGSVPSISPLTANHLYTAAGTPTITVWIDGVVLARSTISVTLPPLTWYSVPPGTDPVAFIDGHTKTFSNVGFLFKSGANYPYTVTLRALMHNFVLNIYGGSANAVWTYMGPRGGANGATMCWSGISLPGSTGVKVAHITIASDFPADSKPSYVGGWNPMGTKDFTLAYCSGQHITDLFDPIDCTCPFMASCQVPLVGDDDGYGTYSAAGNSFFGIIGCDFEVSRFQHLIRGTADGWDIEQCTLSCPSGNGCISINAGSDIFVGNCTFAGGPVGCGRVLSPGQSVDRCIFRSCSSPSGSSSSYIVDPASIDVLIDSCTDDFPSGQGVLIQGNEPANKVAGALARTIDDVAICDCAFIGTGTTGAALRIDGTTDGIHLVNNTFSVPKGTFILNGTADILDLEPTPHASIVEDSGNILDEAAVNGHFVKGTVVGIGSQTTQIGVTLSGWNALGGHDISPTTNPATGP